MVPVDGRPAKVLAGRGVRAAPRPQLSRASKGAVLLCGPKLSVALEPLSIGSKR